MPKISGNAPNCSATGIPGAGGDEVEPELADGEPGAGPELEDQERRAGSGPRARRASAEPGRRGRRSWLARATAVRRARAVGRPRLAQMAVMRGVYPTPAVGVGHGCVTECVTTPALERLTSGSASAPARSPAPAAARSAGRPPCAGPPARASRSGSPGCVLALAASGFVLRHQQPGERGDRVGLGARRVGDRHPEVGVRLEVGARGRRAHALEGRLDELRRPRS